MGASPTEARHKEPSSAINPSPPQSNITEYQSLLPVLPSPLRSHNATTPKTERSLYAQSLSELETFFPSFLVATPLSLSPHFIFFSREHASTTDGEFLRHEKWRERLTNCTTEGKERSASKFLRQSAAPSILMVRLPRVKVSKLGQGDMTGLVWVRGGGYRWGRVSVFLFCV